VLPGYVLQNIMVYPGFLVIGMFVSGVLIGFVFTVRRYASMIHAVVMCPSVCLSVRQTVCHKPALYQKG